MGAALLPFLIENREWFLLHKKQWLGVLYNMEFCTPDFVKELQTESDSQFQNAFLRLTTYSFLHNSLFPHVLLFRKVCYVAELRGMYLKKFNFLGHFNFFHKFHFRSTNFMEIKIKFVVSYFVQKRHETESISNN